MIAGVGLIVAGVLVLLWVRRRRGHVPDTIDPHSGSPIPPFNPLSAYDPPSSNPAERYDPYTGYNPPTSNNLTPSRRAELFSDMALVPNRLISSSIPRNLNSNNASQDIVTPFSGTPTDSNSSGTYSRKTQLAISNSTAANTPPIPEMGHSPSSSRQDMSPLLTDEQADFINSLHQNNVPAAAIARVVERMLVDRHAGIREWERETRLARTNTMTTAPPSYDLVAERGQLLQDNT